jgi:hypothetical protein
MANVTEIPAVEPGQTSLIDLSRDTTPPPAPVQPVNPPQAAPNIPPPVDASQLDPSRTYAEHPGAQGYIDVTGIDPMQLQNIGLVPIDPLTIQHVISNQKYGGAGGALIAGAQSLLPGEEYALQGLGVNPETIRGYEEEHPAATFLGGVAGSTALGGVIGDALGLASGADSALFGLGRGSLEEQATLRAAVAAKLGPAFQEFAPEVNLASNKSLGQLFSGYTSQASIGATQGLQNYFQNSYIDHDPITWDAAAAHVGLGALTGAATEGIIQGLGIAIPQAWEKASDALKGLRSAAAKATGTGVDNSVFQAAKDAAATETKQGVKSAFGQVGKQAAKAAKDLPTASDIADEFTKAHNSSAAAIEDHNDFSLKDIKTQLFNNQIDPTSGIISGLDFIDKAKTQLSNAAELGLDVNPEIHGIVSDLEKNINKIAAVNSITKNRESAGNAFEALFNAKNALDELEDSTAKGLSKNLNKILYNPDNFGEAAAKYSNLAAKLDAFKSSTEAIKNIYPEAIENGRMNQSAARDIFQQIQDDKDVKNASLFENHRNNMESVIDEARDLYPHILDDPSIDRTNLQDWLGKIREAEDNIGKNTVNDNPAGKYQARGVGAKVGFGGFGQYYVAHALAHAVGLPGAAGLGLMYGLRAIGGVAGIRNLATAAIKSGAGQVVSAALHGAAPALLDKVLDRHSKRDENIKSRLPEIQDALAQYQSSPTALAKVNEDIHRGMNSVLPNTTFNSTLGQQRKLNALAPFVPSKKLNTPFNKNVSGMNSTQMRKLSSVYGALDKPGKEYMEALATGQTTPDAIRAHAKAFPALHGAQTQDLLKGFAKAKDPIVNNRHLISVHTGINASDPHMVAALQMNFSVPAPQVNPTVPTKSGGDRQPKIAQRDAIGVSERNSLLGRES